MQTQDALAREWDYVVVGSGAGGGVLAARLAEAGMRVFLLEAGGDPQEGERLPDDREVPAFHAFACENPLLAWNFYVRHYADEAAARRDPKYREGQGVLYPRAAALGGCTVHNAMIYMLAHDSDWEGIATLTGDASWRAHHMQRYARRIEDCGYRPLWRALRHVGLDPTGHGWNGWLRTEKAMPLSVLQDGPLVRTLLASVGGFAGRLPMPLLSAWRWATRGLGDPNVPSRGGQAFEGVCYTPLATRRHARAVVRERVHDVMRRHPERLHVELDALATRVLFDAQGGASGVEFMKGARLYRAHVQPAAGRPAALREVHALREVILAGGAFNTPQLLMLSGVGDPQHLRAHGIPVRVELPGVGRNLQDRYEVALSFRMPAPWEALAQARWQRGDGLWQRWRQRASGMYGSNGAALGLVTRSLHAEADPDLFSMALLAQFEGYAPGFSAVIREHADRLSWAILKGHTRNRAGTVRLRSADPLDTPEIDFHYFGDQPGTDEDLAALVQAMRDVRRLTAPLIEAGWIAQELAPGPQVRSDAELARYVRDTAWGHHASCSCPIGPREAGGVLDSRLHVHGAARLRVADASAFPRIPGFFIMAPVMMLAEKAADMVLHSARDAPAGPDIP